MFNAPNVSKHTQIELGLSCHFRQRTALNILYPSHQPFISAKYSVSLGDPAMRPIGTQPASYE